ncbi:bifunctional 2-C-methyl-D-erythritol 4-phosphate cytidylyltransferase/2-C-methyl-D-erythritol 2,4-cyclodiphosphate synthase [Xanthobacter sp. TB0139]|uniref:bifunctional 2-C-methyl-D-erythritol 4-phosphate cytidylyltransferase/2-C-methyl-D-erythritol 2,4-cyclodiphosphate synthase n=1 Tax=Xanthobacter sp. TB0139 TaxID=3459178 RepID=UPI0040396C4E
MSCVAIIVAAGRGTRAGGGLPKQYHQMAGEPILRHTLRLFANMPGITAILPVIHLNDADLFAQAAIGLEKILTPVEGGATRQESVHAGLKVLAGHAPELVLVHDAARPFATPALLARAIKAAGEHGAAIPVLSVTDTIKQVDAEGQVVATLQRDALRTVQTPQSFRYNLLHSAHEAAAQAGIRNLTDDAAVMEWAGQPVFTFEGEAANMKLTSVEDMEKARMAAPVAQQKSTPSWASLGDVRTGTGFDVHAFAPGDHVILGGVTITHSAGLSGHSDADVGLHALTDALLGALCDGDIGSHFPPSDPQWKGTSSDRFLRHAVDKVRSLGGRIAHLDLTLICEAPKIGPHREAMRASISAICDIPAARISVKATTSEKLGFTGRREGIAAMASATIRLPFSEGDA